MRFLRNSLLLFFFLFPSFVFSNEGECWLSQDDDGHFTIWCEGDGIIYQTVTKEEIVYTYGNCATIKSALLDAVSDLNQYVQSLNDEAYDLSLQLNRLSAAVSTLEENGVVSHSDLVPVWSRIEDCNIPVGHIIELTSNFSETSANLTSSINSINCASCPTNSVSGDGSQCGGEVDFTPILEKMNEAQETRVKIQEDLEISKSVFVGISNTVTYVSFLLEQGFGSTTNELAQINSFLSSVTNFPSLYNQDWYNRINLGPFSPKFVRRLNYRGEMKSISFSLLPFSSYSDPKQNYFMALFAQGVIQTDALISLNNYWSFFHEKSVPSLTNTLINLTEASTNFFSFFKEDLTVEPVLRDYFNSAQYEDMTYYEFLTNHYIQASKVAGGNLSGDEAQKTNWFSRIETLVAALVFSDNSKSTNTVDVSSAEDTARSVTDGLSSINSSAVQQSDSLSTSSQSLIQLFTSYCDIFDSAALPSSVVLVSFSNGEGNNSTDIEFGISSNPSFSFMIDSFRFVTTFSWAAVGIFLLWKFIVWASSSVFSACKFVYTMLTKTFR